MSDINTVKAQIQSLIDLANTTTGNTDTNLTDGVNALVSGYGQGGSGDSSDGASGSYADQLYDFYGVDKGVYPYLYLLVDSTSAILYFMQKKNSDGSFETGFWTGSINGLDVTDFTDIENILSQIMAKNVSLQAMNFVYLGKTSQNQKVYSNFDFNDIDYRLDEVEEPLPYDGLANVYDVMFYDENNEGLAFYSIKEGHSINPPVYACNEWQTSDGTKVEFPYTPTEDIVLYANSSNYVSQLYEFYGVDSEVYPYILLTYNSSSSYLCVYFMKTINANNSSTTTLGYHCVGSLTLSEPLTEINAQELYQSCVSYIPTLKTVNSNLSLTLSTTHYVASNFELKNTAPSGKYSLYE